MEDAVVRMLHFLGIFTLVSAIVCQHLLIKKEMDINSFKKLAIIDGIYGLGATITLIAGLMLWFSVGKPAAFYTGNFIFHIKLSVFVLIGLMSIAPTYFFLRNRKSTKNIVILPRYIIIIIRIELGLLVIMPCLAALIGQGIGLK